MSDIHNTIDDLMLENRKFPPSAEFKKQALVADTSLYDEAARTTRFLARQAATCDLETAGKTSANGTAQRAWFVAASSRSYNCLDRHVEGAAATRGVLWEGEPGDARVLTYADLSTSAAVRQRAQVSRRAAR